MTSLASSQTSLSATSSLSGMPPDTSRPGRSSSVSTALFTSPGASDPSAMRPFLMNTLSLFSDFSDFSFFTLTNALVAAPVPVLRTSTRTSTVSPGTATPSLSWTS